MLLDQEALSLAAGAEHFVGRIYVYLNWSMEQQVAMLLAAALSPVRMAVVAGRQVVVAGTGDGWPCWWS